MKTFKNILFAGVAGLAIGATAALLYAPDTGEKTRKRLDKQMKNSRKDIENLKKDLDNLSKKARKVVQS